jgi:hypothetical protein
MMKLLQFTLGILFIMVVVYSCRAKYLPPVVATNSNYLVVEGVINSSNTDSTFIKLSRTVPLNNIISIKAESGAQLSVEGDNNTAYPLKELKTPGTYSVAPLNLNKAAKYRLRIITADRKTYLSDFVPVKETPVIDSLGYTLPANGLQIYINTHDVTNNTRYYRYEYTETWKFISAYYSGFTTVAPGYNIIVPRTPSQRIDICWGNNVSADIVLISSANLAKDILSQAPVTIVPAASEKLRIEYSILVKQYALTKEGFNFWQNLKKNTEQLGSIFDAQPSTINGNIHNIDNSAEPVFGYISAGTVQQKRIFVFNNNLPSSWGSDQSFYQKCTPDTVYAGSPGSPIKTFPDYFYGKSPVWVPLSVVAIRVIPPYDTVSYTGISRQCADCTLRGTNKQPAFWK